MSTPSKGGRGKKAPYSTNLCRIPEPIKKSVERFATAYRILSFNNDSEGCRNLIKSVDDATANSGEAEDEIKRLKLELAVVNAKIEASINEQEFAITNLLTAFSLGSRDGVKIKEVISIAIPEVKERYKNSAKSKKGEKK